MFKTEEGSYYLLLATCYLLLTIYYILLTTRNEMFKTEEGFGSTVRRLLRVEGTAFLSRGMQRNLIAVRPMCACARASACTRARARVHAEARAHAHIGRTAIRLRCMPRERKAVPSTRSSRRTVEPKPSSVLNISFLVVSSM